VPSLEKAGAVIERKVRARTSPYAQAAAALRERRPFNQVFTPEITVLGPVDTPVGAHTPPELAYAAHCALGVGCGAAIHRAFLEPAGTSAPSKVCATDRSGAQAAAVLTMRRPSRHIVAPKVAVLGPQDVPVRTNLPRGRRGR